ncbi:GntR family transcriptional regulator, partial [Klebsiella pneumoniae]|nr:GntR family transcriptional regulator [Klebsiella pneumoniae]
LRRQRQMCIRDSTESALQTEFGVSRVTVRQALRQLVEQQILESIQGSGTYVKEERVNYDIFQLTSFDEKLSDRHVDTHSEVCLLYTSDAADEARSVDLGG